MMYQTIEIPFYHDDKQKVSVGALKYNLTGSNSEVMEMVIVLPDKTDGLSKLEVRVSFAFQFVLINSKNKY